MARNYKKEAAYEDRPEQVRRRVSRNRARAAMVKAGRAKKGDGKEVDHKNFNPLNNSKKNLRVVSEHTNVIKQPKRKGRK